MRFCWCSDRLVQYGVVLVDSAGLPTVFGTQIDPLFNVDRLEGNLLLRKEQVELGLSFPRKRRDVPCARGTELAVRCNGIRPRPTILLFAALSCLSSVLTRQSAGYGEASMAEENSLFVGMREREWQ
jgi:hypothetical protein